MVLFLVPSFWLVSCLYRVCVFWCVCGVCGCLSLHALLSWACGCRGCGVMVTIRVVVGVNCAVVVLSVSIQQKNPFCMLLITIWIHFQMLEPPLGVLIRAQKAIQGTNCVIFDYVSPMPVACLHLAWIVQVLEHTYYKPCLYYNENRFGLRKQ